MSDQGDSAMSPDVASWPGSKSSAYFTLASPSDADYNFSMRFLWLRTAFHNSSTNTISAILIAFFGLFMLLHEADVEWTYRRLLISGVETTGTVVSIEKGRISHPIFEYVVEHRIYRVRSNQSRYLRASEKTPKIGDTITVVYDTKNPNLSEIKIQGVTPALLSVFFGAILTIAGCLAFRAVALNDERSFFYWLLNFRRK